jgi:hypothetical protein
VRFGEHQNIAITITTIIIIINIIVEAVKEKKGGVGGRRK